MILLLLTTLAWGSNPEYVYLQKGDIAPFNGRLMSDSAIDLITQEIVNAPEVCRIEMEYQLAMLETEKNEEIKKLKSVIKFNNTVHDTKILEQKKRIQELEELKTPPRWRLWFGLGLITGVGTTIAIANAVN
tara:strand:+ start:1279 stop:1674 length:396 start_codon:yes stop_codon:yes gene_type:complete